MEWTAHLGRSGRLISFQVGLVFASRGSGLWGRVRLRSGGRLEAEIQELELKRYVKTYELILWSSY